MRSLLKLIILAIFLFSLSCAGEMKPSTPVDTFKAYALAYKKKDTTTMKLLLSDASLKMAEQQAQAQNVTVDDIVRNETLFSENQKDFFFRNEKIEGDRATIEVKNSFDSWDTILLVREEGVWKIDKQGMANQIQQQTDFDTKKLDELINQDNPQDGNFNPTMPQNPTVNPTRPQDFSVDPVNPAATPPPEKNDSIKVQPSVITNQSVQPQN